MRPLAIQRLDGHVAMCDGKAIAWYSMAAVRWNWRPESQREAMVNATAQRLAQLVGRRIHLRVTCRPESPATWGQRLVSTTPAALPGFAPHVERCAARLEGLNLADKCAYIGVELARPPSRFLGRIGRGLEALQIAEPLATVDRIVAGPGLDATPITPTEMEWLVHRSVALGCPPPDGGDLDAAVDRAAWATQPYGRSVEVVADIGGQQVTRHVVVMTLGRMAEMDTDDASWFPWLARVDWLGFPVELAATLDVLPAHVTASRSQRAMLRIRSQTEHYAEHDMIAMMPRSLASQQERAAEVADEVEQGLAGLATRVDGWFRLATSGATEDEALERAAKVADLYSPAIEVVRPAGQYGLAREFIPCEALSGTAYRRRMPVTTAAAAQPAVTAMVGHRGGMYVGYTDGPGGRHSVFWDLHRSMETNRSGLTLIVGVPGSGKSSLLGQVVYSSTLAGVRWVVLDPAGATARLTELPDLAPYARHTNLMNAVPGTLCPYRVIATPTRDRFSTHAAYAHAVTMAASQRRQLCGDILQMFLPPAIGEQAESQIALHAAIRRVPPEPDASPRQVLSALRDETTFDGDHELARRARIVADFLEDVAELPTAQLVFPTGSADLDYSRADDNIHLEVVSMQGLVLPRPGADRREYTSEEAMAAPLLQLAAHRVAQVMYAGKGRGGIAIDECWQIGRVASGRSLLADLARQSRRMNTRVLLASQQVGDLLTADISNLVDSCFIGRLEDHQAQVDALRILRVPVGVGFESTLGSLSRHSKREMVFSDGQGQMERVVIDLAHLSPEVQAALNTTPTGVATV